MKRAMRINPDDNTATALNDIDAGEAVSLVSKSGPIGDMTARQEIPFGHKLAVVDIKKGDKILKYGEVIGLATEQISELSAQAIGELVVDRHRRDQFHGHASAHLVVKHVDFFVDRPKAIHSVVPRHDLEKVDEDRRHARSQHAVQDGNLALV